MHPRWGLTGGFRRAEYTFLLGFCGDFLKADGELLGFISSSAFAIFGKLLSRRSLRLAEAQSSGDWLAG
jgi:hypothetical protein